VQANDFCEICKRPLSQDDTDWDRWETNGKLVHKNCVIAKSSVKATGRHIKNILIKIFHPNLLKKF
jgi:hypothetical protein